MPRTLLSKRLLWLAYWLTPSLICLFLHRDGLHAWFQRDDFAWLGMNTEYYNARTFWSAVFRPAPQGNIRPITERLFYFATWHWFGWNALPARILVMVTQCANLLLLTGLVRRLSGSAIAGFVAPALWVANAAMVTAMAWTSAYEEILCAFFLLAALTIWVRFCDTGKRAYYWAQIAVFLIGFGVLEINLIYPALAASYAWLYHRRSLVWTVPLFFVSAAFYKLHTTLAPTPAAGAYHPQFDLSLFRTLAEYWKLAFVPSYGFITEQPVPAAAFLFAVTAGLGLFLLFEIRQKRYAALFFVTWFLIVLAPMLPFRNHISDYYLTIPLAGLAATLALALTRRPIPGAIVIALYLAIQLPLLAIGERWFLDRSREARTLVLGVKQIHEWEPTKTILLTDVSPDLYGVSVADGPFRLIRDARVFLAPECLATLTGMAANLAPASEYALPAGATRNGLMHGQLVVYSAAGGPLQEVTAPYTAHALAMPEPELPRRVDVGAPLLSYVLGPEWYPLEGPYRWMPKRATLRMAGPRTAYEKLYITGFTAPESRRLQPLLLTVMIDNNAAQTAPIGPTADTFTREFTLPTAAIGKPAINLLVEVNHTFGRDRELGLVFGVFEIR